MITVYFQDSYGNSRPIGETCDLTGASAIICGFLADHSYTSYCQRTWQHDGKTFIDVGSHSEKFWLDKEVL